MRSYGPDEDEITLELWHNKPGGTEVLFTRHFRGDEMSAAWATGREMAEGLRAGYGVTLTQRILTSWHGEA